MDITNDDVYMATTYDEFVTAVILKGRGLGGKKELVYDAVSVLGIVALMLYYKVNT